MLPLTFKRPFTPSDSVVMPPAVSEPLTVMLWQVKASAQRPSPLTETALYSPPEKSPRPSI